MPSALTKACPKCEEVKPLDEFGTRGPASGGKPRSYCPACTRSYQAELRHKDPEHQREIARRKKQRRLAANPNIAREYREQNPEKVRAQRKLNYAVEAGKLIRPRECEVCGTDEFAIHAHHDDYSKPLDVEWLCAPCHGSIHHKPEEVAA